MNKLKIIAVMLMAFTASAIAANSSAPLYKRADASVEDRVRDLLQRMTLKEKIAQLQSTWVVPVGANVAGIYKNGHVDEQIARKSLSDGLGTFSTLNIIGPIPALEGVQLNNAVQHWVIKNTRLGIPLFFHGEALHGAVVDGATSFPEAIGLGSTWDRTLLRQMFAIVALESRAAGNSQVLAPVLDLARDPRFGRIEEMYSEDPFLVGEMGLAAVQGLQGSGPVIDQDHVLATAKHFVHGQPENGTNVGPNDFSERTMRTVFLSPFEKAVKIGKIGSVMPSYNENNGGIPSSANPWLLLEVLRKEWGFNGITVSDYFAVPQLTQQHRVAKNIADAGSLALNSGLDMELPNAAGFSTLEEAVQAGTVNESRIDEAAARVLTAKFNAGLFEHPYADTKRTTQLVGNKSHGQLARTVASEAIVLLKNESHLLPLNLSGIKRIAVIGPNAAKARLGGYSGKPPYFVTVLDGIRRRAGSGVQITYAEGVNISEHDDPAGPNVMIPYEPPSAEKNESLIAEAVKTARASQLVVLVLGGNEKVSHESFGSDFNGKPNYGDTDALELPGQQNELVREIMKLGKPTVAVLLNGRPYSIEQLSNAVPAIVEGWYLGQETGNAVADVLFGDVNPSGHLPVTIARNVGQLPVFYYRTPTSRLGYVFSSNEPLYPFGFGLSYTTYIYGKPVLDKTTITRDGTATVSVTVANTGARAGDEVVQLYIHPETSSVTQPILRLAGYERIHLNAGESKDVHFVVGPEQLAIWDLNMQHVVETGKVEIMVGSSAVQTASVELDVSR